MPLTFSFSFSNTLEKKKDRKTVVAARHQWLSNENTSLTILSLSQKRQRKVCLLIITYHKGSSKPGCHQWQCSHFFHLRLQPQILPVKEKEEMFTTHSAMEFPSVWREECIFSLKPNVLLYFTNRFNLVHCFLFIQRLSS